MQTPVKKYPFKNMLAMVEAILSKEEGARIDEVSRAGNSCLPDTSEVTAMASFLINLGKVEKINKGWMRIIPRTLTTQHTTPRRFRTKYLQDIVSIINLLSEFPLNADEIAIKTGIDKKIVKDYLHFLENLTATGKIKKYGSQFFNEKW
ncbi:MAG: hypothetical protein ACTSUE_01820 [Promethearchaeota archaeon]